jgi:hypothetical protein
MKTSARIFLLLLIVSIFAGLAHADCTQGENVTCVTSFTISPDAIVGDNSSVAIGQATAHIATRNNSWELEIRQPAVSAGLAIRPQFISVRTAEALALLGGVLLPAPACLLNSLARMRARPLFRLT